jgi:hypothetical protein
VSFRGRRALAGAALQLAAERPLDGRGHPLVEDRHEQLALLSACGCRYVQGFLLGRPAAPEQVRLT